MEKELDIDEIGHIAKLIDRDMTIFERMKISKKTVIKIILALSFYFIAMLTFSIVL